MFWHFRTKCSFPKTKRTSLILFLFITYNKKASKKMYFFDAFYCVIYSIIRKNH